MALSHRPRNRIERSQILAALDKYAPRHRVIVALLETFAPARAEYVATAKPVPGATAAAARARVDLRTAVDGFDVAFRRWNHSVLDAKGRRRVGELTVLLGYAPGVFLQRSPEIKASVMERVLPVLAVDATLGGDPARLEELAAAAAPLWDLITAYAAALRSRKERVQRSEQATRAFEEGWSLLVDVIRKFDPNPDATLPTFRRRPRKGRGEPATRSSSPGSPPRAPGS